MGGRGASSGRSVNGKQYGTEFKSLLTDGNIKFVVKLEGNVTAPRETMTKNRVYVTIDSLGKPKYVSYYDKENKRKKQIDMDKPHMGVLPHTHHGYNHRENDTAKGFAYPTDKEKKMVERINSVWKEKGYERWKRWKASR